jgi:hypothetical protein
MLFLERLARRIVPVIGSFFPGPFESSDTANLKHPLPPFKRPPNQAGLSSLAYLLYKIARPYRAGCISMFLRAASATARWVCLPIALLHALLQSRGCGSTRSDAPFFFRAMPSVALCVGPPFPGLTRAFAGAVAALLVLRALQLALWLRSAPPLRRDGRLRLLIVGDSIPPKVDGVAVRVSHLVPALLGHGHVVHIVNSKRAAPLGAASVAQLPGFESELYRGHSITYPNVLAMLREILSFRPHVVHILDEAMIQGATQIAANMCLTPTVWSHHSRLDLFGRACA